MSLRNDVPILLENMKLGENKLEHNKILFDIFEGSLLKYILADLEQQLSPKNFEQIKYRIAPINVLKRIIDKLSKIYSKDPTREVIGSGKDKAIYDYYFQSMRPGVEFNLGNEFFNLFKNCWVEPYLDNGRPRMRALPSDRFIVYSNDPVNPLRPTHLTKLMGESYRMGKDGKIKKIQKMYHYTDIEFLITDQNGEVLEEEMALSGAEDGINPYGTLPGVYINRSKYNICPTPDTDVLQMTKLLPILLSDLNFAVMYQAFSIIYGIDIDDENIQMSPNAFWRFKSDSTGISEKKPQLGVIKPEVDIQQVVELIQFQLSFWLNSKNIKPGAIGSLTVDNAASGISKMIDEMDTSEDRQKQVPVFEDAEQEFWRKVAHNFHPVWAANRDVEIVQSFSPSAHVDVEFVEQLPMSSRKSVVEEQKLEVEAGFTTKKRAIKRLNPDMSDLDIDELLLEMSEERNIAIPEQQEVEAAPDMEDGDEEGQRRSSAG